MRLNQVATFGAALVAAALGCRCPSRCCVPATPHVACNFADEGWPGGFIAHHYTRYLGDLSGGQAISRIMQREFGFETNGVAFYLFEGIASPKEFKDTYRTQLDSVEWDDAERERVIDEVLLAYRFNTELFIDLAAAKAAA